MHDESVTPRPAWLGEQVAAAFQDVSVATAYAARPPYPPETFAVLADLILTTPRHVLDVGCGTGLLARPLAPLVARVDAVDVSPAMIEQGRRLPGGAHPHLHWRIGRAEDVPLTPPYALITAGDSLHWLEWSVILPRFARLLAPQGYLVILSVEWTPPAWDDDLHALLRRYSTISNYQPYNVVEEVEARGFFQRVGTHRTRPVPLTQSVDAYVASFHGRASCSPERMPPRDLASFDQALRDLVTRYCPHGVELQIMADLVWGRPSPRGTP